MAGEMKATDDAVVQSPANEKKSKVAASGIKKPKVKSSYPAIPIMVNTAIKELKERNGSSVHAIRKYLREAYKATSDVVYMHMKKYLRTGVAEGKLVQTRGHGAYGSFRLPAAKKSKGLKKPAAAEKSSIKPPKKSAAVSKKKSSTKKSNPIVKKVATGRVKKTAATKKPIAKNRGVIKIVLKVKRTKAKTVTVKNIKTPKSRSASKK